MKKRTYVLIIFLIFIGLAAAGIISYFMLELGQPRVTVPTHAYLEINLSGNIEEIVFPDLISSLMGDKALSMYDLWMNIRKAKSDSRIGAILVRLNSLNCGWAKVTELRDLILDFRKSGKKVYAYFDEAPDVDKEYYLATACDKIILHPMGWLGINGIGGEIPFYKNTLDKLGIQAEFEHVEEYKTAYNSFTEKGFTPAHKEMMESLYGDIFKTYVKTVAAARKKSEDEFKKLIDVGFFQGESARKAGLIDDLLYEDELQTLLQGRGEKPGRITSEEYSRVNPVSLGINTGRKVALIYATGTILSGESFSQYMGGDTVARWIRAARQDKSIAAIVFRIDSPGGSSVASDVIWRETFLAKKEKPFIVSMSDVAGSGGYWISMTAHKIVAQPQTLTGSIGILAGKFSLAGLYDKLGITSEKLVFGERADIFSTFRAFTPEEKKSLKDQLLWFYDRFLSKVAEGRNMTKEEVNKIGRGRVWTGNQALDNKLVDALGGLSQAIELAKDRAGIRRDEEVKLVVWPKKRTFWETLFGRRDSSALLKTNPKFKKVILTLKLMEATRIWAIMPLGI